jgi:hypothetical protein
MPIYRNNKQIRQSLKRRNSKQQRRDVARKMLTYTGTQSRYESTGKLVDQIFKQLKIKNS